MTRRSARDAYWTPPHLTQALLDLVPEVQGTVWEPCAGAGWMSNVLAERCTVVASDIAPMAPGVHVRDALRDEAPACDWVVTNPPFNLAGRILARALTVTPRVALLVRMTFLEATRDRADLLAENPPARVIVLPRTDFPRGDDRPQRGTDSVPPVWLVWGVPPCPVQWGCRPEGQARLL